MNSDVSPHADDVTGQDAFTQRLYDVSARLPTLPGRERSLEGNALDLELGYGTIIEPKVGEIRDES